MSEVVLDFQPIEMAPKDGRRLVFWNPNVGIWVGSWRKPLLGEPFSSSSSECAWRDAGGRCMSPVLFSEHPTDVEMLRLPESKRWLKMKEAKP